MVGLRTTIFLERSGFNKVLDGNIDTGEEGGGWASRLARISLCRGPTPSMIVRVSSVEETLWSYCQDRDARVPVLTEEYRARSPFGDRPIWRLCGPAVIIRRTKK